MRLRDEGTRPARRDAGRRISAAVFDRPVTISTKALAAPAVGQAVSGISCTQLTLLVVPLSVGTSDAAFRRALAQAPGADTLVDWQMSFNAYAIVGSLLYLQSCVQVEGTAVKASELLSRSSPPRP